MNTYSVTLNISPYKKLDMGVVNHLIEVYNIKENTERYNFKNFNSMDHDDQKTLLSSIINCVVKSFHDVDVSDLNYEFTKKDNLHVHLHLIAFSNIDQAIDKAMELINLHFSSGQKYKALLIEKTTRDIRFWKKYENKEQWLTTLTKEQFPDNEILI